MSAGTLFVVATPLGNSGDLSPRAAEVLESVDIVACEDTRTSGIFLDSKGIHPKKLVACHKFNEDESGQRLVESLESGSSVALITDAGTPCISDPGTAVVAAAANRGITVSPVPGPSACIAAISVSGFNAIAFSFFGFLPKKDSEIRSVFRRISGDYARVAVFYESPKRIKNTVELLAEVTPGAELCLCNDLTKKFERIYRGSPSEVLDELRANPDSEKGEYAFVVRLPSEGERVMSAAGMSPRAALAEAVLDGKDLRDAVAELAAEGVFSKNELKRAAIEIKEKFDIE